eukprot:TRINITY_DN66960_c2_g4_i1.p1 TRINITY_DN66960_c2_g4~~TRINITY_DN66960_c2_g4_i1.p1  ORF type:complete len:195 (-),score=3.53 TRINITY_DN66960_c2_g4_i1:102-686(-)
MGQSHSQVVRKELQVERMKTEHNLAMTKLRAEQKAEMDRIEADTFQEYLSTLERRKDDLKAFFDLDNLGENVTKVEDVLSWTQEDLENKGGVAKALVGILGNLVGAIVTPMVSGNVSGIKSVKRSLFKSQTCLFRGQPVRVQLASMFSIETEMKKSWFSTSNSSHSCAAFCLRIDHVVTQDPVFTADEIKQITF